jgi:hypothetical protein
MKLDCVRKVLLSSAVVAAVVLASGPAQAQIKKSDSVVKLKATADKPDGEGNQTIIITLDIDNPWHLYANPVDNDMLAPAQTTVKVLSKIDGDVNVTYPPGKVIKDKDLGDYKTFEGKVTIKAQVKRVKGDTGPLNLSVKIQACDDKRCLATSTVKLTVE